MAVRGGHGKMLIDGKNRNKKSRVDVNMHNKIIKAITDNSKLFTNLIVGLLG